MAENALRGSLFGGFKRDDVVRYIESSTAEHKEHTDALLKENERLSKENEALAEEAAQLREELEHAKAEIERITPLLEQAQSEAAALREEIEPLRREMAELQDDNNALRAQAEEFNTTKLHLTEIELNARQHADQILHEAQGKVAESVNACREKCNGILETLDASCKNAENTFHQASKSVATLPDTFRTLRKQLDDL